TPEEIGRLRGLRHLDPYLRRKEKEIEAWNARLEGGGTAADRRRLTNVGTFRAYVEAYLKGHPRIRQDMTLLARQLQPGREGLPIELYCFTDTIAWNDYETIQADIFDHLFAVLPEFGLRV